MSPWRHLPAALIAAAALTSAAFADTWPSKTITWVVPFAPAGSTDVVARTVGQQMGAILRQTVIIDTKPGAGKLKLLAVTSEKRSSLAPDVPTMAEAGVKGFNLVSWQAVYAPKGTPKEIVKKLNEAVVAAVRSPEVKSKLETTFGMEVVGSTPEELTALMKTDIPRLGALVKKTGATAE